MFVTIVEAHVEPEREADLRTAWSATTRASTLPAGLIESLLLKADGDVWRIVTVWESRDAVLAMRRDGPPAALVMFELAGAKPEVTMWTGEGHTDRSGEA